VCVQKNGEILTVTKEEAEKERPGRHYISFVFKQFQKHLPGNRTTPIKMVDVPLP